jgi:ferritin-like metal-binding protein YciE
MPEPGTLHDAFLDELRDTYDAELQVTKALPTMVNAATSPKLKAAFEAHLKETRGQVSRLEKAFANLEEKVQGKHCDGMAGILKEGKAVMAEDFDETTMDACLIASAQRVEHYEMAAYGTLVAWARSMSHSEVADLLEETLNEEKSADSRLSLLARDGINRKASAATPMASARRGH